MNTPSSKYVPSGQLLQPPTQKNFRIVYVDINDLVLPVLFWQLIRKASIAAILAWITPSNLLNCKNIYETDTISNKMLTAHQAGISPANPRTLFVGHSQSHRKSWRIWDKYLKNLMNIVFQVHLNIADSTAVHRKPIKKSRPGDTINNFL